ncbi:hypothetical protein JCM12298_23890 [Desulfothermus naphthae]
MQILKKVIRTIKEEVIWINKFTSLTEATETISKWLKKDYNKLYVHSTLGYKSPEEFEQEYYKLHYKKAA